MEEQLEQAGLSYVSLALGLLINFGGRRLRWRRVFPSPQTKRRQSQPWLFVTKSLRQQRNHSHA